MALIHFARSNNSSMDESCKPQDDETRMTFKTWQEMLDYMQIDPVELPWNANGLTTLQRLREKYKTTLPELKNPKLDEIVRTFSDSGNIRQIEALGTALQEIGLVLCLIEMNSNQLSVFIRRKDKEEEWKKRWNAAEWHRHHYRILRTIALERNVSLEISTDKKLIPMTSVQVADIHLVYYGWRDYCILDNFLVIPYDVDRPDSASPEKQARVFDLRYWPIHAIENVKCTYNRNNIEPYTLEINTDCGEKFCYAGTNEFKWYQTRENENGEFIPLYDEERSNRSSWNSVYTIGQNPPESIPEIEDAQPMVAIDNCIIYQYRQPDIEHRDPAEENMTPTMRYLKMGEYRKKRNTLIEYNTTTKKYRKLSLPGIFSVRNEDIDVYKNTWLILRESRLYGHSSSYLLRLWNPRTNECLRLTEKDIGNVRINSIIPLPTGDVLFLLDDGRLCHPDVDLVSWLKQDLQHHQIVLDDWQDEKRRAFENFPKSYYRRSRLRNNAINDHIMITFNDDTTYDILIREDDI